MTLQDGENWNATHSFSGRIWRASGILLCYAHYI
ncbi:SdpI family protein [Agathobacter rectalis]